MTAKRISIYIEFDNIPGKFDYPKNLPLPRIGETVVFDTSQGTKSAVVYDLRHVIVGKYADINIKVK